MNNMCIIVVKNKGVDLPKKSVLQNCFDNNPDGCGYMYNDSEGVHIRKGFMTFEAFEKDYDKMAEKVDFKNATVVYHFRISTQAGVNRECTHPYPLSSNMKDMKKLYVKSNIGVAHNGIISLTSSYMVRDHNDTMEFITDYLSLIIKNNNFYEDKATIKLIERLCGSKLAILDKNGHCTMIGDKAHQWVHDKKTDLYFSNTSYQERTYKWTSPYKKSYNVSSKNSYFAKSNAGIKDIADYNYQYNCGANDDLDEDYGEYSGTISLDFNGKNYEFDTRDLNYEDDLGKWETYYSVNAIETDKDGNTKNVDLIVVYDWDADTYTISEVFD